MSKSIHIDQQNIINTSLKTKEVNKMKLTNEQLSTIKEIMDSHLHNLVLPFIPKMLQKVSSVRVKNTKKVFTIESLSWHDINNYYGCNVVNDSNEKILTFTYADHELGTEYMYDINARTCIVIGLPDDRCFINVNI